jgi:phenylalanyl-tRNA synthetase alpha subunit
MGPERITMLRHRIEDIRYFWANDCASWSSSRELEML